MFLLRSSYRLLVAVCFLLGVNVFTILVLNQTGGLSPGKMTAHQEPIDMSAFAFSIILWLLLGERPGRFLCKWGGWSFVVITVNTSVHVQVFTVTSILFTHNCV